MARRKKAKAATHVRGTDRISALHESILHHILSFLPARDLVRTRALSRRWHSVPASTTNVQPDDRPLRSSTLFTIDQVSPLRKLHITGFRFPARLGSSLGTVVASACPLLGDWSLVGCAGLDDLVVDCRLLESLEVRNSPGMNTLHVVGEQLRTIRVERCFLGPRQSAEESSGESAFRVVAPGLRELVWRGWVHHYSSDAPMAVLDSVRIDFEHVGVDDGFGDLSSRRVRVLLRAFLVGYAEDPTGLCQLFCSLAAAKSMTISGPSLELLGLVRMKGRLPPVPAFPSLRVLNIMQRMATVCQFLVALSSLLSELHLPNKGREMMMTSKLGPCWFFAHTPSLRILDVDISCRDKDVSAAVLTWGFKNFATLKQSLWDLQIRGFHGDEPEMRLVRFLLGGALPSLRRVAIKPSKSACQDPNVRKAIEELMGKHAKPRSSYSSCFSSGFVQVQFL